MKIIRALCLIVLFAGICAPTAFTQETAAGSPTESKEEREKARQELEKNTARLVEQIVGDAALLKLPENRAVIYANAGDLLWKTDEKRARNLFRQAAEELIAGQAEMEKASEETPFMPFQNTQPRQQILQTIAKRDASLALDLLVQTRPPKLQAELQKAAAENAQTAKTEEQSAGMARWEGKFLIENELRLEQSFATQAAANDPARSVKLIRQSLAIGVSGEVLNMLRKLNDKDSEAANSLLAEVGQKLLDADFSKRDTERRTAFAFIRTFTTPPKESAKSDAAKPEATNANTAKNPLKADDRLLKDLANKLIDNFLQAKNFTALFEIGSMQPTLEKLVPEKAPQIKQKQAALKKTAPPEVADFEGFSAMSNPEAKPEDLIKSAAKMPAGARGFVYERAVRQLVDKGEAERARQLLNEAPAGADRDKALASLDSKLAEKAVKDDKFEEARKIIDKISNKTAQTEQLVKLAVGFHNKNTKESKEAALKLMEEARRSVDENPQNEDEINALLAVIAGYAVVKPDLAFSLLSPLIDQTNELTQAAALLSKYNKRDRRFRNGEMSFALGLGQMQMRGFRYGKEIGLLAAADFERTRSLTDKLQRPDAQIYARLVLAQSILSERNAPSANNQFFSEDIGEGIVIMN